MTAGVVLAAYDATAARPLLDRLVEVYLEVYGDTGDPFHAEDRYRRQLAGHLTAPGWRLVTAAVGAELAGYAYGFPLPAHSRWWEGLRTAVPANFTDEDGTRTFAVSEIMVRVRWRRRGVARALHDALLAGRPEPRATLLADPANVPAQTAYADWGWRKVGRLRPGWEHAPLFDVLLRP
ncbi:MAG TPA: GNAT family N-acetyltransferase [Pilimelia sp.]|nr:GNAT family N-acetyltransferase [Pilimelia sp.]